MATAAGPTIASLSPDFSSPNQAPSAQLTTQSVKGASTTAAPTVNPVITPTGGNQNTNTNTSNNGSNSGLDPHINPATGVWDDNYYASHNGSNSSNNLQDQINSQINALYSGSYDYLNQAESNLNADYPNTQSQIQGTYDTNAQQLSNAQSQANAGLNLQSDQNSYASENALAAARRLYSEQMQGAQQRFGGSTSAGDAANQVLGVAQQQQMGQTQRTYANIGAQINLAHTNVNQNYDLQLSKLQQDKSTALQQAQSDFNSKLLQIQGDRANIGQAKAQSSLDLLNSYRNQVFAINQQNLQFQQTLAAQRNQAAAYIGNYTTSLADYANSTQGAYNQALQSTGYNVPQTSVFGNSNTQQQTSTNPYTGAIGQPNYQKYPNDGFSY